MSNPIPLNVNRPFKLSTLSLTTILVLTSSIGAAQSDSEHPTNEIEVSLTLELIAEAEQSEVVAAKTRNEDHLRREILYFAKRHRFVRVNDAKLEEATRLVIRFFDDVSVTADLMEFHRTPGMNVWRGVIVDPVLSGQLFEYPSGKPMNKDATREIRESQNSITIYAHILPSTVRGSSTSRRSIQLGVQVAAMDNATFVVESLIEDPLIHVVYELDQEKCCFATLDTPIDPDSLSGTRALEKGRAYKKYLEELDAETTNRIDSELEE